MEEGQIEDEQINNRQLLDQNEGEGMFFIEIYISNWNYE